MQRAYYSVELRELSSGLAVSLEGRRVAEGRGSEVFGKEDSRRRQSAFAERHER